MRPSLALLILVISLSIPQNCLSQIVKGLVTDSLNKPIEDVAVFIPFTSMGTTTNSNGEYVLVLNSQHHLELLFKHIGYEFVSEEIVISNGEELLLNVQLKKKVTELNVVTKTARSINSRVGYEKFAEIVLGDGYGRRCKLSNKKDLRFHREGDKLIARASKPLQIRNQYLGYEITYFLDYFWWEEKLLLPDDTTTHISYAFSGTAIYEDLTTNNKLRKSYWERNRMEEFRKTKRAFLQGFYDGIENQEHIGVYEVWRNSEEYFNHCNLSPAVAFAKYHEMNKVYYWDSNTYTGCYLSYQPSINCSFLPIKEYQAQNSIRAFEIQGNKSYLIIFDNNSEKIQMVNRMALFTIESDLDQKLSLKIDYYGNFSIHPQGSILWEYLDHESNLYYALPEDYLGRE